MKTFVMVKAETEIIENVVIAESIAYPTLVYGEQGYTFFELSSESGPAHIGLKAKDGKCQPFASWTWSTSKKEWTPPSPKPDDDTAWWDEEAGEWKVLIKEAE